VNDDQRTALFLVVLFLLLLLAAWLLAGRWSQLEHGPADRIGGP
jgi:hypothetical protein